MTWCAVCQADVHPYTELRIGGPVTKCPRCRGGLVAEGAIVQTTEVIAPANSPHEEANVAARVVSVHDDNRTTAQATPRAKPIDVLTAAKERLALVDAEIEKLRTLESEQALLRRMIAAAEPTAEVIPLRKQG